MGLCFQQKMMVTAENNPDSEAEIKTRATSWTGRKHIQSHVSTI